TGRTLASGAARANSAFVPSTSTLITAGYRTDRTTASDGKRELGGPLLEEPTLLSRGHRRGAAAVGEELQDAASRAGRASLYTVRTLHCRPRGPAITMRP